MSEGLVVEIRRGSGEPRYLELTRGAPLQPLGVGLRADWRIEANGVLDVHAYLYFDGQALFVQSASPTDPVRVNGRVVPAEWTAVEPPCTVAFGDARLVYCPLTQATAVASQAGRTMTPRPAAGRTPQPAKPPPSRRRAPEPAPLPAQVPAPLPASLDEDDASETIADVPLSALAAQLPARAPAPAPAPSPAPVGARPAAVRPRAQRDLVAQPEPRDDDEATSSIPLPGGKPIPPAQPDLEPYPDDETTRALPLPAIAPSIALPRPVAPVAAPPPAGAPLIAPLPTAAPEPAGAPEPGPIDAPPPAAPVVEKPSPLATLKAQWKEASLPKRAILVLLPFAFVAVAFGLDDGPTPAPKKPPATAIATASSSADVEPAAAKPEPKPEKAEPKKADPEIEDLAEPQPTAKPVAKVESTKPDKQPEKAAPASGKTLERSAVDAVAAGAWLHAAELYTQLANEHPEVPAYKEAARILRAKAKK